MKTVIAFIAGIILSAAVVMGGTQLSASEPTAEGTLEALLPDIESIYQEALTLPFEQAGEEITDPKLAAFYQKLMQQSGILVDPED